jgi:hypothetical protein
VGQRVAHDVDQRVEAHACFEKRFVELVHVLEQDGLFGVLLERVADGRILETFIRPKEPVAIHRSTHGAMMLRFMHNPEEMIGLPAHRHLVRTRAFVNRINAEGQKEFSCGVRACPAASGDQRNHRTAFSGPKSADVVVPLAHRHQGTHHPSEDQTSLVHRPTQNQILLD